MSVSLAVPSYSVTLGGFDITNNITNLSFNYPAVGLTVPQAKIGSITLHSRIAADFDDQVLPSRWSRGQQVLIITILGYKAFTGYILFYRYDRQTNIGEGDIGDQLALQNFDRTAVEIPITVAIRDNPEGIRYSQFIDSQSNFLRYLSFAASSPSPLSSNFTQQGIPPITYTQQPNSVTVSLPVPFVIPAQRPDRFIFQGTDVSEIVYQLVLASGFIEGNQIFSDIDRPVLTGDISIPIVATNPIQEAQKYAGADRVFCHTNRDGRIVWKEYPTSGAPIFQLREDDCAVFKPDLTVDRRWFETVIVSGQIDIQVSNPDYIPARTITTVFKGQASSGGGGLSIAVPFVFTDSFPAVGDPYLPETIPIAGQAKFTSNGLTPYLPTTENINVGYLYSVPQADRLANFLGNLQLQKANSYLVQIPINIAWLNNPDPFQICHISDCALIMDAVEIVIEENMAYMAFTGNKIGTIPTITNPAAPAAIPTPIISATNQQGNLERELSDIGAINTTLSDFFGGEREYSGVGFLVGGAAQWHRSEEALSLAFDNIGVTQWGDLSGNNINFRAIAGAEPNTELLSRLNGKQVISWLTVNDGFFVDLISVSSPCEFYIVIRTQAWTGSRRILGAGDLSLTVNGTTLTLTVGTTSLTRTLAVDTWAVVSFAVNGTASYLAVNSSVINGTLPNFASDFLVLGSAAAYRIAEFIRYGFVLSSGDRALNLAYLEDRYDFTNRASDPDIVGTPDPIVPPTPPIPPDFVTDAELTTAIADFLVEADLRTINGNSIVGSGDLVISGGGGRETLIANRTYFVRTDGSDSNDGLTDASGGSFLTWQKAVDVAASLDSSIYDVIIQAGGTGARTFTLSANIELKPLLGSGELILQGNTSNNAEVLLTSATAFVYIINGGQAGRFRVKALRFTHTNSGVAGAGIASIIGGCIIKMENCNFGAFNDPNAHLLILQNGLIERVGAYTISGGAALHLNIAIGGFANWIGDNSAATVTLTGTPNFSNCFISANERSGYRSSTMISFSGAATGVRFRVQNLSIIQTFGGGVNYFPGNAAGVTTAATYGVYA